MTGGLPARSRSAAAERARQALLDHHQLTNRALAALADCAEMTIQRQRHLMHAEGLIPEPRPHGGGWPDVRDHARRMAILHRGVSSYELARLAGCTPSTAWHAQHWLRTEATRRDQAEIWASEYPDASVEELRLLSGLDSSQFRGLRPPGGVQQRGREQHGHFRPPRMFRQAHLGLCSQPGADPEDWTGDDQAGHKRAIVTCQACPVTQDCLTFAMLLPPYQDRWGVWGGMTAQQRARLRRQWQHNLATA